MKNLSLLSLAVLVAAASPLVAASWLDSSVTCGRSGSTYAANSTYEASLHHLAAVLPAAAVASALHGPLGVDHAIDYWLNYRLQATAICRSSNGDACAACVAEAFKEVERVCPFRREASFIGRHCYLSFEEFRVFRGNYVYGRNIMIQTLAMGMIFQAFGLACLFFLFIQVWRHDRKKDAMIEEARLWGLDRAKKLQELVMGSVEELVQVARRRHTPILSGDQ